MKSTTRTMIILLAMFVTSTIFISCNKKVPAFPQELTAYFPYTLGQELVFNDDEGNEMSFTINNVYISQEGSYKRCTKCAWSPYMEFESEPNEDNHIYGGLFANIDNLQVNIHIKSHYFSDSIFCLNPLADNAITLIGDNIEITNNNGEKIVIIRGKGIVKYSIDNVTWNLVE
jgi:hypothetical protein